MIAIILNSGKGSRLKELTQDNNKCLVNLDDNTTILSKQIDTLLQVGIEDIIITTGYLQDNIINYINSKYKNNNIKFVYNELYDSTNYIVSLERLIDLKFNDVVLMHGDLVFEKSVLFDIINSDTSSVVIDSTKSLPEKDFKAKILNNRVKEIGINISGIDCFACQPLYHLLEEDWTLWQKEIHKFCISENTNVYAENALNQITNKLEITPLDVLGRLCMEVDTKEDLEQVQKELRK